MGTKEDLLVGLKPVLLTQTKSDLALGKVTQPIVFADVSKHVWRSLRTNLQTGGALLFFGIKRKDIDKLLREVFEELKVEIK